MKKTENCIICYKKANLWTGHVTKGKVKITAGFCDNHKITSQYLTFIGDVGRYGDYQKQFGIISDDTAL